MLWYLWILLPCQLDWKQFVWYEISQNCDLNIATNQSVYTFVICMRFSYDLSRRKSMLNVMVNRHYELWHKEVFLWKNSKGCQFFLVSKTYQCYQKWFAEIKAMLEVTWKTVFYSFSHEKLTIVKSHETQFCPAKSSIYTLMFNNDNKHLHKWV